jgi:hypothetical protein
MIVDVVPPPGQLVPRFSPVTLTVTKLLGPFGRGVHQAESVLLEQLRRSRGRINK